VIYTTLLFLAILSVLIFAHELGHFFVAKKAGIKVEEFGFGLPPRILGKKIGETVYSLNFLPVGGFVKLLGEESLEGISEKEKKRAFFAKSKKVRMAILFAGVFMNFLLAVFCFSIVYLKAGIPVETDKVKVVAVLPGSPAQKAGLKEDDVIISASGERIKNTSDFLNVTNNHLGESFEIEVSRQKDNPCREGPSVDGEVLGAWPGLEISCRGENLLLKVLPRKEYPEGEGPLGIVISQVEFVHYSFFKQIFLGTIEGFKEAFAWLSLIFNSLILMLAKFVTLGQVPKDVAGPVGIFQITSQVGKTGFLSILQFVGVLSVNLAVINILPLPALDGGRLLFVGFETLIGRKIKAQVERLVHTVGIAVLLFLFLLITINDISRILEASGFLSKLKSLLPF